MIWLLLVRCNYTAANLIAEAKHLGFESFDDYVTYALLVQTASQLSKKIEEHNLHVLSMDYTTIGYFLAAAKNSQRQKLK